MRVGFRHVRRDYGGVGKDGKWKREFSYINYVYHGTGG